MYMYVMYVALIYISEGRQVYTRGHKYTNVSSKSSGDTILPLSSYLFIHSLSIQSTVGDWCISKVDRRWQ